MRSLARLCASSAVLLVLLFAGANASFAQPPDGPENYVGGMIQASFGNVTSQAFGLEAGFGVTSSIGIFVEAGRVVDTAPASTGEAAQLIAATLGKTQPNVGFSVTVPTTFADAGVRYQIALNGKLQPYVMAGAGIGQVKPDVTFTINDVKVNDRLDQFGVVLGSDLSGSTTKVMIVLGAGARYPLGDRFYAEGEFRYNRVLISDGAIPFSRAGIGLGVRF